MTLTANSQEVPVRIVGSSVFGIYQTVSAERTYNMYITRSGNGEEEWLVNFPGYAAILEMFETNLEGRGTFRSIRGGFVIAVVAGAIFRINAFTEEPTQIGTMDSTTGEVVIDENLSGQICIVGGQKAYIYNYLLAPNTVSLAAYTGAGAPTSSDFLPNYVTYQNTYFIFGNAVSTSAGSQWYIFEQDSTVTPSSIKFVKLLTLQTKSDFARAALRIPGKGNNLIVYGSTVAEIWTNVGGQKVYQRNSSVNIDFGTVSVSTIAANDQFVAWLGINEKSTASIMVMTGGGAEEISTDGIDHVLERVKFPERSTAFLYRQGGHTFYVLTFTDIADNFTIFYDFTTKKFFDLTDWNFTAFPARQIIYFNNKTYFISYKDGKMYQLSSDFTTYDTFPNATPERVDRIYDIPCQRITNTHRLTRPEKQKINLFTFVMESGTTANAYDIPICFGYILNEQTNGIIYDENDLPLLVEGGYCYTNKPRVDLTISKNGGNSYSNVVSYELKATGNFHNQPRFINLGYAQQITYQLRFWGSGRKVVKNGTMEIGG